MKELFELLCLLYQTVPEIHCRLPFPHTTTAHVSSDIHFWNSGTYDTYVAGLLLPADKTIIYLAAYSKRITIQGYEFV